jgi:hypothetical protein
LEEHLSLTGRLGAAHLFSSMVTKLKFNPQICANYMVGTVWGTVSASCYLTSYR